MSNTIGGPSIGNLTWNSDLKVDGPKPNTDQDGVGMNKTPTAMQLPLPNPSSKPDMMKMMAAFEDLIILMSTMAKEIQKGEREAELAGLAAKISLLMSAAQEKEKGADKIMSQAITSLVISVVSAAISVIGAGISLKGAVDGTKAATKATTEISKNNKAFAEAQKIEKLTKGAIKTPDGLKHIGLSDQLSGVGGAFTRASAKLTGIGSVMEGVSKGVGAGAGYASSKGQAESMRAQAESDRLQARAEEAGTHAQRSQQLQQDMRDLLGKMTELLNAFYQAQDKISSAAAH